MDMRVADYKGAGGLNGRHLFGGQFQRQRLGHFRHIVAPVRKLCCKLDRFGHGSVPSDYVYWPRRPPLRSRSGDGLAAGH